MSDGLIVIVTIAVLLGIMVFLFGSLIVHIRRARRTDGVRRIWANFGLSLCFCTLFLLSWAAQGLTEWGEYRQTQAAHGEAASLDGFVVEFGQSTLENWQSEFLQLFSFVVLSALLIHRGSAESRDSDDRLEEKIDAIARRLDDLDTSTVATTRAGSNVPHAGTDRPNV